MAAHYLWLWVVAVGGRRIVVWNNDGPDATPGMAWTSSHEKLAGLGPRRKDGAYERRCSCEIVSRRYPRSDLEAWVALRDVEVVLVPFQFLGGFWLTKACEDDRRFSFLAPNASWFRVRGLLKRPLFVLYWREPIMSRGIPPPVHVQESFDLLMGPQFTADVVNPSFFLDDATYLRGRFRKPFRERPGFAVWVSSHCREHPRTTYVRALSQLIDVDVYGSCANELAQEIRNKKQIFNILEDKNQSLFSKKTSHYSSVAALVSNYKFYLSFENTLVSGYVSEKLLRTPILAGTVPVYLGAPDVKNLPSIDGTNEPWFVDVFDFDTPHHLADYLQSLASDENKWTKYVAYADRLFPPEGKHNSTLFPKAPQPVRDAAGDFRHLAICRLCDSDIARRPHALITSPASPDCLFATWNCLFEPGWSCRRDNNNDTRPCPSKVNWGLSNQRWRTRRGTKGRHQ